MFHILLCLFASGWQPLAPMGYANPLTVHGMGDTLLVCGTGGCATTGDRGRTWQPRRADDAYAMAPVFSGRTGVTSFENTLHRSLDGGRTWSSWSEGIGGDMRIRSVEIRGDLSIAAAHDRVGPWNQDGFVQTCNWYLRNLGDPAWRRIGRKPTNNDRCAKFHIGAEGMLFRTLDTLLSGETCPRPYSQTSPDGGKTWILGEIGETISRVRGSREVFTRGSSSGSGILSFDSGRTWTSLDLPGVPGSIAEVPSGILLSTDGAGLWQLDSASLRSAGTGNGPHRAPTANLRMAGSRIRISGVSPGVHLRLVDPSGRVLLRTQPEVRDGTALVPLPPRATGILLAELRDAGSRTVHRLTIPRP